MVPFDHGVQPEIPLAKLVLVSGLTDGGSIHRMTPTLLAPCKFAAAADRAELLTVLLSRSEFRRR